MSREQFTMSNAAPTTDGRTLTFLANSGTRMINGLTVDLATLKAPLADGSLKLINELTDSDTLTVPLLIDHIPSVDCQAGTVTKLWLDKDGLMAAATLSHVDEGEKVRQLAADGALTNSFSITIDFRHEPDKDGVIYDAELVEISVVYRGADSKAAFRSLNMRGNEMTDITVNTGAIDTALAKFKLTPDEADELKTAITDALQSALDEALSSVSDVTEGDNTDNTDDTTDDNPAPQPPTQSANNRKETTVGTKPIVIRTNNGAPSVATFGHDRKTWLDSPDAFNAFERIAFDPANSSPEMVREKWGAFARNELTKTASFGIEEADVSKLIPTEAVTIIDDALNTRGSGIWNMLGNSGLDRLTIGANISGLTEDTRAHGYPVESYGTEKKQQKIALVDRRLEADYTYKYIQLNKGDIRRTQRPGALLRYVLSELPNYIVNTIERQIVLGGYDDMKHFRSIQTDRADTASDWAGNRFALTVEHGTSSVLLYDFVRAAYKVTAPGTKILVTSADMLTDLLLSQDAEGRTLIDLGATGVAARLGVSQIITPEWWTSADADTALGVVFTPANYQRVGDTSIEAFTNFSLHNNTNEYLQEIYAGGGLAREKSAAVIVPTAAGGNAGTGKTTGK